MKKLFTIFFATLLCLFSINTVYAKDIYVSDEAHILSNSEINDLNVIAENLEADYGIGVYFMAYDSHNIDTFEYGNDYLSKVNSEKAVGLVINLDDYSYTFVSKGDVDFDEYDYDYLIQCFEYEDTYYDAVSSYMKEAALKYQLLNNSDVADERKYDLLVDDANLLSENEKQNLLASLNEVSQRQKMDIVVVTCYSLNGKSATAYADDFFDYNGYGQNSTRDGILLLISMEARDYAISTRGYAIDVFSDHRLDDMVDHFINDLSSGDYYDAFNTFVNDCDRYISQGVEYHDDNHLNVQNKESSFMIFGIGSLAVALVAALVSMQVERAKLKSVKPNRQAMNYVKDNGMHLYRSNDIYLYHHITRTPRPKENSDGGGGSSIHMGSSGASHGGTSGKF